MKKIMLVCSLGMSTSMLVEKMREAAAEKEIEVDIEAVSESELSNQKDVDIAMLGRQIGHLEGQLMEKMNLAVMTKDMTEYMMKDGEKLVTSALEALEEERA